MANLEAMIEKRHPTPGWQVMFEVSNGTGYRRETRYADAVAFGIWPSHGHEIHGFEIKRSRTDLQKELGDPRKADAIGNYCDYWWLVLDDYKLCEGIVIPPTWGILAPRGQILKVFRKAPKRKAKPLDRSLAAALIRRVTEHWVPKHHHEEFKKNATETLRAEVERDVKHAKDGTVRMLEDAKREVKAFEEWSGVKLTRDASSFDEPHQIRFDYNLKDVGEAVRLVAAARRQHYGFSNQQTAADVLRQELRNVEMQLAHMERSAGFRRDSADHLRREIAKIEAECQSGLISNPDGPASPAPSSAPEPSDEYDDGCDYEPPCAGPS